jgi:hypothetical protein
LDSVAAFLDAAGPFLVGREAEHCLTLGVASNLVADPDPAAEPPYLSVVTDRGTVVFAVLWTPPWQVVLSACDHPGAVSLVVADLAGRSMVGVHGPTEVARSFVADRSARTGEAVRLLLRERVFQLSTVTRPHGVPGTLRHARPSDRDHLIGWLIAFEREAIGEATPRDPGDWIDRSLGGQGSRLYVWDDDGPVSVCGVSGRTPNGIRIGPVYTPPGLRRRGYASACVAAVSQAQLDAGRRFCFLFADIANRTSVHVYETIGYAPVSDVAVYRFDLP